MIANAWQLQIERLCKKNKPNWLQGAENKMSKNISGHPI
jgi:hypothetical protein